MKSKSNTGKESKIYEYIRSQVTSPWASPWTKAGQHTWLLVEGAATMLQNNCKCHKSISSGKAAANRNAQRENCTVNCIVFVVSIATLGGESCAVKSHWERTSHQHPSMEWWVRAIKTNKQRYGSPKHLFWLKTIMLLSFSDWNQIANKELDLNWLRSKYVWLAKMIKEEYLVSVQFSNCSTQSAAGLFQPSLPSWKDWNWPSSSWAKWDTPSLWGLTAHLSSYLRSYFPPKGLIPNVNSICKWKKKMQNCLVSALNASFKGREKKEGKWCFFFFFSLLRHQGGKNDSDYKYTLFTKSSNSGSLRWCESSVWSPSLGNFSNPSALQKNPKRSDVGGETKKKKKSFCGTLITDYYNPMNKHLSCQLPHYEPRPRDCGAICNLVPRHVFMSSTNSPLRRPPSDVRKAARRASCGPPGLRHAHFLMHHLGFVKANRETSLRVVPGLPRDAKRLIQARRRQSWRRS